MQIIGAPSFFPTVWGWIKRWFDPVTVSKIFILAKHEVKPTLNKFMDPKDFPKRYGGDLEWDWGQTPAIDEETRAAISTDGNEGWVQGPCLWLDHQRVMVGSEHGKLRRPDKEIQEKKPVVYAADYTEEPVHPDRKASGIGGAANGKLDPPKPHHYPSQHAVNAANLASGTAAAASSSRLSSRPTSKRQSKEFDRSAPAPAPAPAPQIAQTTDGAQEIKPENLKAAPMGGATVHVPPNQAAYPQTTAEYVSKDKSREILGNGTATPEIKVSDSEPKQAEPSVAAPAAAVTATATAAASAPPVNGDSVPSRPSTSETASHPHPHPHPPGMPEPGPIPKHTVETLKKVTNKMDGESTSSIPESANGAIPHPEVILASDKSKGLALEKENMDALAVNGGGRPDMQRFVTAAEF